MTSARDVRTESEEVPAVCEAPQFPFIDDVKIEPHPVYTQLRAERPVCPVTTVGGRRAWLITRYDDAKALLTDARLNRAGTVDERTVQAMGIAGPPGRTALIYLDPPDLGRSRWRVAGAFSPSRIQALRPQVQKLVDGLVDELLRGPRPVDLISALARPLPLQVICALLGLPEDCVDSVGDDVEALMVTAGRSPQQVRSAYGRLFAVLGAHVARRRQCPREDLISHLVLDADREPGDEPLTDHELIGLVMLLFVTGHETTTTQITNSCVVLLQSPHHLEQLRDRPDLIDSCVEELLRFVPLGHAGLPFALTHDLDLHSERLQAGDLVYVSKLSANRDESVFPDAAVLDITRHPNPHIAFSHGPHYCLGAGLARLELQVVLETLVRRVPAVRLAQPADELVYRTDSLHRGPVQVPVTW